MNCDELWVELTEKIESLPESTLKVGWHELRTTLQGKRNLILLEADGVQRMSVKKDLSLGDPRPITKYEIYDGFARIAMDAADRRFSISDPNIRPARMGSIVCSLLNLMPEFEYLPGRILRYRGRQEYKKRLKVLPAK